MQHKKYYLLASFLGLLITTFAVSSLVSAATEKSSTTGEVPPCHQEANREFKMMNKVDKEAMNAVMETGDYEAWKALMGEDNKMSELVNQDNFPQFVQMHQLRQAGDMEGAQAIAEELGLPQPGKFFKHKWQDSVAVPEQ